MQTDIYPAATVVDAQSGVSWAAVAAGAVATAALTLLLIAFGAGLGFSAISPWSDTGVSASTFEIGTGIYLIIIGVMSSAIGGYLAGRLRTKWVGVHSNEVFFRDTAHGFLAWAFATLLSATALASATAYLANGSVAAVGGASQASRAVNPSAVYVDRLFRTPPAAQSAAARTAAPATASAAAGNTPAPAGATPTAPATGNANPAPAPAGGTPDTPATGNATSGNAPAQAGAAPAAPATGNAAAGNAAGANGRTVNATNTNQMRAEILRLWTADFTAHKGLTPDDRTYVVDVVAARTGMSRVDAERRVDDVITQAKTAADNARNGAAKLSFWLTAALLFGAFAASLAAAEGGALRDGTWNDRVLTPRII